MQPLLATTVFAADSPAIERMRSKLMEQHADIDRMIDSSRVHQAMNLRVDMPVEHSYSLEGAAPSSAVLKTREKLESAYAIYPSLDGRVTQL